MVHKQAAPGAEDGTPDEGDGGSPLFFKSPSQGMQDGLFRGKGAHAVWQRFPSGPWALRGMAWHDGLLGILGPFAAQHPRAMTGPDLHAGVHRPPEKNGGWWDQTEAWPGADTGEGVPCASGFATRCVRQKRFQRSIPDRSAQGPSMARSQRLHQTSCGHRLFVNEPRASK